MWTKELEQEYQQSIEKMNDAVQQSREKDAANKQYLNEALVAWEEYERKNS